MTGQGYVILGYIVGLGLLWGYALSLWLAARSAARKERAAVEGKPAFAGDES